MVVRKYRMDKTKPKICSLAHKKIDIQQAGNVADEAGGKAHN